MLFNGTNTDPQSQAIYQRWMKQHAGTDRITGSPTADKRAALVENFRDESSIMIATEAAAEGINLQFCNLVVNYDMPWNPQRIEQRIGRCHRYGQKYDVVVVNFLNKANAADVRVYQLLAEKFKLFDGVFGASDEVIGAIESGVEFEKRIVGIYQRCRTTEQIEFQFDQLQQELESQIAQARTDASEQLLNNFDQEVIERVRLSSGNSLSLLGFFKGSAFIRGIKEMPLIDNECFLLRADEFTQVHNFLTPGDQPITLGTLALERGYQIDVGINSLFASHIGIFGNTGSGKSYTLARLYKELFDRYKDNPNFVAKASFFLIDFNGEYVNDEDNVITEKKYKTIYKLSTRNQNGSPSCRRVVDVL